MIAKLSYWYHYLYCEWKAFVNFFVDIWTFDRVITIFALIALLFLVLVVLGAFLV